MKRRDTGWHLTSQLLDTAHLYLAELQHQSSLIDLANRSKPR